MNKNRIFQEIDKLIKSERQKERNLIIKMINIMCNKIREERLVYGTRELIPYFSELRKWFEHDNVPIFEADEKLRSEK